MSLKGIFKGALDAETIKRIWISSGYNNNRGMVSYTIYGETQTGETKKLKGGFFGQGGSNQTGLEAARIEAESLAKKYNCKFDR